MMIRVRLFAVARQLAGAEVISLSLSDDSSVGELRRALAREVPALVPVLPQMLIAVGAEYADDKTRIPADAEVACIPPVSGG